MQERHRSIVIRSLQETSLNQRDIVRFVQALDADFSPPLSSYVDIPQYCAKLESLAKIRVACRQGSIVGMIAFYCSDTTEGKSYISYLGISREARGQSTGLQLVRSAIKCAVSCGMRSMNVRTWKANEPALKMYARAGFKQVNEKRDRADGTASVYLRRELSAAARTLSRR